MEEKNITETVAEEKVTEAKACAKDGACTCEGTEKCSCPDDVALAAEPKIATEDSLSGLTAAQRRRRDIFDKLTTALLVILMASPVAILAYIFIWFILNITNR